MEASGDDYGFTPALTLALSPRERLAGVVQWGADERYSGLIAQPTGERFTLYPGERAGVRADVEPNVFVPANP
jgi:hypothetical protein